MDQGEEKKEIPIKSIYPTFTEEERKIAEENLERYLELMLKIHERLSKEQSFEI